MLAEGCWRGWAEGGKGVEKYRCATFDAISWEKR